ncbi:uncharacterized protein LOC113307756 [Papaver somniferum]|uniref:uncharacterized protein LOC113307756 n=1 Tax=Papaver somniferum TaxID=3469 RepID=UPI000E6FEEBE|nr:uncharacterized protein LOC113307756 [Papaver somniferum]
MGFRSLLNTVILHTKNINGTSSSTKPLLNHSFIQQNQSLLLLLVPIEGIRFISSTTNQDSSPSSSSSDVVSYLINSCGLSKEKAITTGKKIKLKKLSSQQDDALTLLQTYGFDKSQISKLITKVPSILLINPHKTLKPKLEFFNSKGLSGIELANFFTCNPYIFRASLNLIIPLYDALKGILHKDEIVIGTLKRCVMGYAQGHVMNLKLNIGLLRNEGVPEYDIFKSVTRRPRGILITNVRFKKLVENARRLGFEPRFNSSNFIEGLQVLLSMSESSWERKLLVYKRLGWSDTEIRVSFMKLPNCMRYSEKKITLIVDFLVNEMGYIRSDIASSPRVLGSSLNDTIIPRCSVLRMLVSKGLIEKLIKPTTFATMTERRFLDKFVFKYEKEATELFKVYQGQSLC